VSYAFKGTPCRHHEGSERKKIAHHIDEWQDQVNEELEIIEIASWNKQ
jgi:hypothetical protein